MYLYENSAIIGYSGFVGSSLCKQAPFGYKYNSKNIDEIRGKNFEMVICAGAPAQKYLANRNPESDWSTIDRLITCLREVNCQRFVLISTVDVFGAPVMVDEASMVDSDGLHPYGMNRMKLEEFVRRHFANYMIVRLPGLVGPGLKKNLIFDLKNQNRDVSHDWRSVYQFYPVVNLLWDIEIGLRFNMPLLHLTAEPVTVREVAAECFRIDWDMSGSSLPARYDFRTMYSKYWGRFGSYQYTKADSLLAIRAYAQS